MDDNAIDFNNPLYRNSVSSDDMRKYNTEVNKRYFKQNRQIPCWGRPHICPILADDLDIMERIDFDISI